MNAKPTQNNKFSAYSEIKLIHGLDYFESAVSTDNLGAVNAIWKLSLLKSQGVHRDRAWDIVRKSQTKKRLLNLCLNSAGVEMLKLILSKKYDIETPKNPNSFFLAIRKGDIKVIEYIHSLSPKLYLETDSNTKNTALCVAFRHKHVLQYLIEDLGFSIERLCDIKQFDRNQIFFHAASFTFTTPESFRYLFELIENSDNIIRNSNESGQNVADLAGFYNNTNLYEYLVYELKVFPEQAETLRKYDPHVLAVKTWKYDEVENNCEMTEAIHDPASTVGIHTMNLLEKSVSQSLRPGVHQDCTRSAPGWHQGCTRSDPQGWCGMLKPNFPYRV